MSTFTVSITRIRDIEPIANADAIELAVVGDYRSVVKKGEFSKGELVAYIPEAALVPQWLLAKLGLTGRLAGPENNRVKAIKLRGCLSQGILYPVRQLKKTTCSVEINENGDTMVFNEGEDIKQFVGITKWEPTIPSYMSGDLYNAGLEVTLSYDIENIKKFPDVLVDGEEIVITEKIHGTFCGVGIVPLKDANDKHIHRRIVVFSKGLGGQGLCFQDSDTSRGNVYFRALENIKMFDKLEQHAAKVQSEVPLFVLGEVYGQGVQDLSYGASQVSFRAFDIAKGYRGQMRYLDFAEYVAMCELLGIDAVPVLYRGRYSKEVVTQHTNGTETVSGNNTNIREGVVVKPTTERSHYELGRVILKSVSEAYLLRKGNATEFQ